MDVKLAAKRTMHHALGINRGLDDRHKPSATVAHLNYMNARIQSGEVTGDKAQRWLGWMQAVVYQRVPELEAETLKALNRDA